MNFDFLNRFFGNGNTSTSKAKRQRGRSLRMESLENRELLSVSPSLSLANGILTIDGTQDDDHVAVETSAAQLIVRTGEFSQTVIGTYATSAVSKIVFNGYGGNDTFKNFTAVDDVLDGGDGNNLLLGGKGTTTLVNSGIGSNCFAVNGNSVQWANGSSLGSDDSLIFFATANRQGSTSGSYAGQTISYVAWSTTNIENVLSTVSSVYGSIGNYAYFRNNNTGSGEIYMMVSDSYGVLGSVYGYNSGGDMVYRENAVNSRLTIHEVGHNWDSTAENPFFNEFAAISYSGSVLKSDAVAGDFAFGERGIGGSSYEDWAYTISLVFDGYGTNNQSLSAPATAKYLQKVDVINRFGAWLGTRSSVPVGLDVTVFTHDRYAEFWLDYDYWMANLGSGVTYKLYHSDASGNKGADTGATVTTSWLNGNVTRAMRVTGLEPSSTTYYILEATNGSGETVSSGVLTAVTKHAALSVGDSLDLSSARTLDNEAIDWNTLLSDNRYIVVTFVAPWCQYSAEEIDYLMEHVYDTYKPLGLEIISAYTLSTVSAYKAQVAEKGIPWINITDSYLDIDYSDYYVLTGVPATFVIDCATGKVINDWVSAGYLASLRWEDPVPTPGSTIATAESAWLINNTFSATHRIGDGPNDTKDVHMYAVTVSTADVGRTLTFTTSQPTGKPLFDTYIRLFNASGTELVSNDDIDYNGGNWYSSLTFMPTVAGTYYLGVSSYGNSGYFPTVAGSGNGGDTGNYTLTISSASSGNPDIIFTVGSNILVGNYLVNGVGSTAWQGGVGSYTNPVADVADIWVGTNTAISTTASSAGNTSTMSLMASLSGNQACFTAELQSIMDCNTTALYVGSSSGLTLAAWIRRDNYVPYHVELSQSGSVSSVWTGETAWIGAGLKAGSSVSSGVNSFGDHDFLENGGLRLSGGSGGLLGTEANTSGSYSKDGTNLFSKNGYVNKNGAQGVYNQTTTYNGEVYQQVWWQQVSCSTDGMHWGLDSGYVQATAKLNFTLTISLVDPLNPKLQRIETNKAIPVTGKSIELKAVFDQDIMKDDRYKIVDVQWDVRHVNGSRDNYNSTSNEFPPENGRYNYDYSSHTQTLTTIFVPDLGKHGKKTVTCTVVLENKSTLECIQLTANLDELMIFFEHDGTKIPAQGAEPNWYYWWKKDGAVPELKNTLWYTEYPHQKEIPAGTLAFYAHSTDKVYVGAGLSNGLPAESISLLNGTLYFADGSGKDAIHGLAAVVAHEFEHKRLADNDKITFIRNDLVIPIEEREYYAKKSGFVVGSQSERIFWEENWDLFIIFRQVSDRVSPVDEHDGNYPDTWNVLNDTWAIASQGFSCVRPHWREEYENYGDNELRARLVQQQALLDRLGKEKKDWSNRGSQAEELRKKLGLPSLYPSETVSISPQISTTNHAALGTGSGSAQPSTGTTYTDVTKKTDGNTKSDELVISVTLNIPKGGNYAFSADLYGKNDFYITNLFAEMDLTTGTQTIDLHFDGKILGTLGISGPYELDLRVYDDQANIIEGGVAVHTTQAYMATDFEQMLDVIVKSETPADMSTNGLYDTLTITTEIIAPAAGTYNFGGYLYSATGEMVTYVVFSQNLDAGVNQVDFVFSGMDIAASKLNGPYSFSINSFIGKDAVVYSGDNIYQTTAYRHTQFEGSQLITDAPANLRATTIAQTVLALQWNAVPDATQYVLQRSTNGTDFTEVYRGAVAMCVDTGLTAGTTYLYRVQSVGSAFSAIVPMTTSSVEAVDTPVILSTVAQDGKVTITWTDLGSDYRYIVYKNGALVVNFGRDASYVDTSPSSTNTYYVYAFNDVEERWTWATPVVVTTTAPVIAITAHEVLPDGKIKLSWSGNANVTIYAVYNCGYQISSNLYPNSMGLLEWTDPNPIAENQYQIYAFYTDSEGIGRWTWSNLYFAQKPIQQLAVASSSLDAFWSEYGLNGIEDELFLGV